MMVRVMKFVEVQTKITSIFPFFMVLAYLFAVAQPIKWGRTWIFFLAMLLIDLATTAMNNYIDTRTNGLALPIDRRLGLAILLLLLLGGGIMGLWLVALTDVVVLVAGGLCFVCGVFYTFGPVPLNHTPLGEVFSGVFYGFAIPFILLYINLPQGSMLTLDLSWQTVELRLQIKPMLTLALLAVAPACATANIMLANNICDLEHDIAVKRHTLPYYLGKQRAIRLFTLLTYGGYVAAFVLVGLRVLPWVYLLLILTAIPVTKNLRIFFTKQDKSTTFSISIVNYILIMSTDVAFLLLSRWLT